jgi:hypothetical protein
MTRTAAQRIGRLGRPIVLGVITVALVAVGALQAGTASAGGPQSPSVPQEITHQLHVSSSVSELPVPPTVPASGMCTNSTGCISAAWGAVGSPGFYWDPHFVLVALTYAGAPSTGPASIYNGPQVALEKTDGTTFPNGDAWKCITCGVSLPTGVLAKYFNYPPPHGLPSDKQILAGNAILQCTNTSGELLTLSNAACTPANIQMFPIYWGANPLGGPGGLLGNGREWRLSPDGVHMEWDNILFSNGSFAEDEFEGTLSWDAADQRYNLTNVYFLPQPSRGWVVTGDQLVFQPQAMIGEARGWSSDGKAILGIQAYEDNSVDGWSTSLTTGRSTPVSVHAEYTDPMSMSPNGRWMVNDEVNGSGRMDWLAGIEGVSPIASNLMTLGAVSQMRNAGNRRFFEPWITSTTAPLTEQVNAAVADPNWNAAADPIWLANSSAVVWAENLACGANAPGGLCASSTEPGARNSRLMIAHLGLPSSPAVAPAPISDTAPSAWAIPYTQGQALPATPPVPTGTYTVKGDVFGSATVVITDNAADTAIDTMAISYHNYVQSRGLNIINGTEDIDATIPGLLTWNEDIRAIGLQGVGRQVTSPGGFTVNTNDLNTNNFQATGTMTTTLNGRTYTQPANGM